MKGFFKDFFKNINPQKYYKVFRYSFYFCGSKYESQKKGNAEEQSIGNFWL